MLRLQATPAGHMWDSAAPSLALLIQPVDLSFFKESSRALQLCQPGVPKRFALCGSLLNHIPSPQSRPVSPGTQMPAPQNPQWPGRVWEPVLMAKNLLTGPQGTPILTLHS